MDSNVSKNTFSHKFFKLRFTEQNSPISIKDLLKQSLLSALDLYQQKTNFSLQDCLIATIDRDKIVLLQSFSQNHQVLLTSLRSSIVYSSSLALLLASQVHQSPDIIAGELVDLLIFQTNNGNSQPELILKVKVEKSGWINFGLEPRAIADWLQKSLIWLPKKTTSQANLTQLASSPNPVPNLFPAQYVHARCCSLLCLGARENLILLQAQDSNTQVTMALSCAESISWLNQQQQLWLQTPAELDLLRCLLLTTDFYAISAQNTDWSKLILNLSQTTTVFWAECNFLGKVRQENLELAIARLGLIALTQAWLKIILVEKLNLVAPLGL